MATSFYIGAYWPSLAESLPQVKNKISDTFKRLSDIDEQFLNWYETGYSRKQALQKKVNIEDDAIEKLCLKKVPKGELNENGFARMGFLFSLWTGHEYRADSGISFNVGTANKALNNSCVIDIPSEGPARERLLSQEKSKKIIAMLVDIWNPDFSILTSDLLNRQLEADNKIGWITYKKSVKRMPEINDNVKYERMNGGHLFIVASENYALSAPIEALASLTDLE